MQAGTPPVGHGFRLTGPTAPAPGLLGTRGGRKSGAGLLHPSTANARSGGIGLTVGVPSIAPGLRLMAIGNLVAGVAIALSGHTVDAIGRNALFQLFHSQR